MRGDGLQIITLVSTHTKWTTTRQRMCVYVCNNGVCVSQCVCALYVCACAPMRVCVPTRACDTKFQDCDGPLMDRSACDWHQSKYHNVKPHSNKISQVTSVMDPQFIIIVSHQRWMSPWGIHGACQMCYHLCPMPCPATMLLGVATLLARKQGTLWPLVAYLKVKHARMGQTPCGVHVGPVATLSGTRMISLTARRTVAALDSALGWSGSMFTVGVDILHSTFECKFAQNS